MDLASQTNPTTPRLVDPDSSAITPPQIDALQQLLFGMTAADHEHLHHLVLDHDERRRLVAEVLSEALEQRDRADASIGQALSRPISTALKRSIADEPEAIADSIYPVIGPSIRKAIHAALTGMVASMNQMIEQRLSVKSLRWRFEAWRTGMDLNQYILLQNLEYRVEQAFLLHNDTGLLLQHASVSGESADDADMISGMLSALQDFVRDSFQLSDTERLDEMVVGDLAVQIESGPHATLAAVVRGSPPANLRLTLREVNEEIHLTLGRNLSEFGGDLAPIEPAAPLLQQCLVSQAKPYSKRSTSWITKIAVILGLVAAVWWIGTQVYANQQESNLVQALREAEGYTVVDVAEKQGRLSVNVLATPTAKSLHAILVEPQPDWIDVQVQRIVPLTTFNALNTAYETLKPPATVNLKFDGNTLSLSGRAEATWYASIADKLNQIPNVQHADVTRLDLVTDYRPVLAQLLQSIESAKFQFDSGAANLTDTNAPVVAQLAANMQQAQTVAELANVDLQFTIEGASDGTGSPTANQRIAEQRAEALLSALGDSATNSRIDTVLHASANELNAPDHRYVIVRAHSTPIHNSQDELK